MQKIYILNYNTFPRDQVEAVLEQHLSWYEQLDDDVCLAICDANEVIGVDNIHVYVINRLINYCKSRNKLHQLYMFVNVTWNRAEWVSKGLPPENVICLEWFELLVRLVHDFNDYIPNTEINLDTNKAVYKVGKIDRLHRLAPVLATQKTKLDVTLGFKMPEKDTEYYNSIQNVHEIITSIRDIDYLYKLDNNIDIDLSDTVDQTTSHYTGFPYDPSIYANTSFSIISESEYRHPNAGCWVTEKTYMPIINKHPFFLISNPGIRAYLESLGYLPYYDFNIGLLSNIYHELDMLYISHPTNAVNTISAAFDDFNRRIQQHSEYTKYLVEHNYNNFYRRTNEVIKQLQHFETPRLNHNPFKHDWLPLLEFFVKDMMYVNWTDSLTPYKYF